MADLVSVVIPVYNTNERFKACFESVLNQKYQNIEVVLVDDGSADISAQICDMVALSTSSFPVFTIHKPNGGVSRARNIGIDFVNGKYLVFVDSDDQISPDYISDFMEAREKYPEVGHVWCGFDHLAKESTLYLYSDKEPMSFLTRDDYLVLNDKVMTQGPCQRLYDVSVIKSHNIKMLENLSLAEDAIFNLEYLDAVRLKNICVINRANYLYYDLSDDSLKNQYRNDLYEIYAMYFQTLKDYLERWGIAQTESFSKYYQIVYFKYLEIMNNTFKANNKRSFTKKIQFNNTILRDKMFAESLAVNDTLIPKKLKWAYQTKNYFWVWLYERVVNLYCRIKQ